METSDKIKEMIPTIYEDTVHPAAKETGQVLSIIPRAIHAALVPLEKWIAEREYNLAETTKLLAKKLEHVGEEHIVSPESYIAVPALQAISYSMDSKELREMFANLLAKSMYDKTKGDVHPAFVEIIKQMSPLDCKVFKAIMAREANPIVEFRVKNQEGMYNVLLRNVTDIFPEEHRMVAVSIDNLIKQKLIDVPYDGFYSHDEIYNPIYEGTLYQEYKRKIKPSVDGYEFNVSKHMISHTELGKDFYNTCVREIEDDDNTVAL